MNNKKILLIGSSGFLGSTILNLFPKGVDVWQTSRYVQKNYDASKKIARVDLTRLDIFEKNLNRIKPDIVINAARIHPYEGEPKHTKKIMNRFVNLIKSIDSKLIYFSSDAIFDGLKGNYRENDKPKPLTDYGKAKLISENIIRTNLDNFIIIRTSYIYSNDRKKQDKRTQDLINRINNNIDIIGYNNMYRSPILVNDLAKICLKLIKQNYSGTIHIAGKKESVLSFYKKIIKHHGYNPNKIVSASLDESSRKIARDTSLNTDLVKKIINIK